MQYGFHFDVKRCAQCFACEVACKSAYGERPYVTEEPGSCGPRRRQVVELMSEDGPTPIQYISMACMHCGDAACLNVCPARAIYRDPQFGAVLVDHSRCLGCRYCSWACEFGAPQFGRDGLMVKCDMCIDRLREGLQPACVESCCGGAITLGPVEGGLNPVREKAAKRLSAAERLL